MSPVVFIGETILTDLGDTHIGGTLYGRAL